MRIAVIQAGSAIYGGNSQEVQAAADAFDEVGIDGPGGNYEKEVDENAGAEFVLFTVEPGNQGIGIKDLSDDQEYWFTMTDPISRPSVTDDGGVVLFVASDKTIHAMVRQTDGSYEESVLQGQQIWGNVIISKDGNRFAAIEEPKTEYISVFDFDVNDWFDFKLYNPTFTQGVVTGDVLFADAMEFDFTGEWIIYDAANEVVQNNGDTYAYWDISFINVFDVKAGDFVRTDYRITKLFSNLPRVQLLPIRLSLRIRLIL